MDFPTLLRRSARAHRHSVAVWCDGSEQTYVQLFERACRLANGLAARGVQPGDRVAVLGPNGLETVEQVAGIALGGFVRSALYAHQTAEVNAYLLELVDARALIVHASLVAGLEDKVADVIVYGDGPSSD
jgi:acyl-CoA synthetase (AMP-forming)/AMP-acid ligase II